VEDKRSGPDDARREPHPTAERSAPSPGSDVERHPLSGKTARALALMLALLAIPYASPKLARFRITAADWHGSEGAAVAAPVLTVGEATLNASKNTGTVANALPDEKKTEEPLAPAVLAKLAGSVAVEDETGAALDAFYGRLAKTIAKEPGAVTRILHYGDSLITSDLISGTMRRKMQARFGDAGHGFILIANPWEWYFHNDVSHGSGDGWNANRITGPLASDGLYGLGGVTFHGLGGATAYFGTAVKGDYGRNVSRFDLYYLEQPAGGDVELKVKGRAPETISTKGPKKVSKKYSVEVPDGEATLTIRATGNGDVRAFGVVLERSGPGVVYDALGANGARLKLWEDTPASHWKEQLELRDPALVIFQYGTNESEAGVLAPDYEETMGKLIENVRAGAPNASILVLAPLDRAEKGPGGRLGTRAIIKKLVETQRKVARDHKVAFWDTFAAMGGEGSMGRWMKEGLGSGDFTHPTPKGAEVLGDLLYKSLVSGYEAWASRHPAVPGRGERRDSGAPKLSPAP
jgi:lysophospholipase L1-like esterase